jgi:hypothetical protein
MSKLLAYSLTCGETRIIRASKRALSDYFRDNILTGIKEGKEALISLKIEEYDEDYINNLPYYE